MEVMKSASLVSPATPYWTCLYQANKGCLVVNSLPAGVGRVSQGRGQVLLPLALALGQIETGR